MRIVVFGAGGGTGRELVKQGLARGHDVTAFVRRPEALAGPGTRVKVVAGDATRDDGRVAEALAGQELAVCTLGVRDTFKAGGLITRALGTILPAMRAAGVPRLILVSAYGVGDSHREAPLVPRIMYRLLLKDIFADKLAAEESLSSSGVEWTIVRPVLLTDGAATGSYRVGEHLSLSGLPKVSRADVAHFILREARARAFLGKVVAMAGA